MNWRLLNCIIVILLATHLSQCEFFLDFETNANASLWFENSDTLVKEGKSKAVISDYITGTFKRIILFTLLRPHETGAAFAGIEMNIQKDFSEAKKVILKIRGEGDFDLYKFFLRHKNIRSVKKPAYCVVFKAPEEFQEVELKIEDFKPYFEGSEVKSAPGLDKTNITGLGMIAFGGLNSGIRQSGIASLEIAWIKVE